MQVGPEQEVIPLAEGDAQSPSCCDMQISDIEMNTSSLHVATSVYRRRASCVEGDPAEFEVLQHHAINIRIESPDLNHKARTAAEIEIFVQIEGCYMRAIYACNVCGYPEFRAPQEGVRCAWLRSYFSSTPKATTQATSYHNQ